MIAISGIKFELYSEKYIHRIKNRTKLPHHINGSTGLSILCRAPEGVIEKLMHEPLKTIGDRFILRWQPVSDCEGYKDIHFNEILFPYRWKDKTDIHCAVEYIDNEMGLIIGREIWGFPKKWGDFVWKETPDGLHLECHKSGELLIRTEFAYSDSPAIEWPFMSNYYLVKHIQPASRTGDSLIQVVRIDFDKKNYTQPQQTQRRLSFSMDNVTPSNNSDL